MYVDVSWETYIASVTLCHWPTRASFSLMSVVGRDAFLEELGDQHVGDLYLYCSLLARGASTGKSVERAPTCMRCNSCCGDTRPHTTIIFSKP